MKSFVRPQGTLKRICPCKGPLRSNTITRNTGIYYTCFRLSQKDWNIIVVANGRRELHRVDRDGIQHTLKIRSLSKEVPAQFPQGLDILDDIDYLVICNNLQGQPKMVILEPETVKRIIHKDWLNDNAYWLQNADYNRCGMTFDQIFA